jgi:hypothetical protein
MVICAADGENEAYGSQDRSDRKGRDGWAYAWCFLSGWCDVGFRRFWNYRTLRVPDWSCSCELKIVRAQHLSCS